MVLQVYRVFIHFTYFTNAYLSYSQLVVKVFESAVYSLDKALKKKCKLLNFSKCLKSIQCKRQPMNQCLS